MWGRLLTCLGSDRRPLRLLVPSPQRGFLLASSVRGNYTEVLATVLADGPFFPEILPCRTTLPTPLISITSTC